MRVAVIGTGGVGGFLGSLLLRAGHDVRFLARGQQLAAINEHGLLLQSKQFGEISSKPVATDDPRQLGPADLVVVAVKMYDFDAAARAAGTALAPTGVAITVQNGLDAPNELARVIGGQHVLTGTASIEAITVGPGRIAHLIPIHAMTLSELTTGPTPRLEKLASEMRVA
jgi:2-dehydropantoate 2-reductase